MKMLQERLRGLLGFWRRRRSPEASSQVELPQAEMPPLNLHGSHATVVSVHTGILPAEPPPGRRVRNFRSDYWDYLLGFVVIALVFMGGRYWMERGLESAATDQRPTSTFWMLPQRLSERLRAPAPVAQDGQASGINLDVVPNPDIAAQPTRQVYALYNQQALRAGFRGKVFVTVIVNEQGVPVKVEATSPIPFDLEVPVRNAVLQWRFRPAYKGGQPVQSRTVVEVPFR